MFDRAAPLPLSHGDAPWWMPVGESRPVLAFIALLAVLLTGGITIGIIGYDHAALNGAWLALAVLWSIGLALRRLNAPRLAGGVQLCVAFIAIALLTALVSAMLAVSARPYIDPWLVRADRWLIPAFDWPHAMLRLQRYRLTLFALTHAYGGLQWEPLILFAIFCATRRERLAWTFLTGWSCALLICLVVFPWAPAQGGYAYFAITAEQVPAVGLRIAWTYLPLLEGLRDGSIATLGSGTLDGIITMPSFHAAGAVLLAWAGWQVRGGRYPLSLLNAAMLVSAVPIGGHYLIDVIVGAAVGGVSVAAARRIGRASHRPRIDTALHIASA